MSELYAYTGKMEEAVRQYLSGYQVALARVPALVPQFEEELGVAYLHKSEMENGVYTRPGDRCLVPMKPEQAYSNKQDSKEAIRYFEKYLEKQPDDLTAKWLLNYAYMTVGAYPSGVPSKQLIPPSVFESQEDAPHFVDVAPQVGLNLVSMAGGV